MLDASAQGLEERGDRECRDHDGDIVLLVDDPPEQVLQSKDEAKVDQGQDSGQGAIDQRAVNDDIDIVQAVAQDRNAKREWDEERGKL